MNRIYGSISKIKFSLYLFKRELSMKTDIRLKNDMFANRIDIPVSHCRFAESSG